MGMTCVFDTYKRMRPLVTKVVVISQGSDDLNSPWARAHFNWFKQLAIRYGKLDPTKFRDPPLPQTLSGGHQVASEYIRYEVEKNLNELVNNVVINSHTSCKHDMFTNDIEELLNQMVDQVVCDCLLNNYVTSVTDKLMDDIEEKFAQFDLVDSGTDSE